MVHAFEDELVVAGQGTLGLELAEQLDTDTEVVVIPIGGGGLAAGASLALKELRPELRIVGELLDMARAHRASAVFLEVRESNRGARALYEKWAFVESGRRKQYYRDTMHGSESSVRVAPST